MAKTKTSTAVKNAWSYNNYDRVVILLKKGEKEKLKATADGNNISVSRFIVNAVNAFSGHQLLSPLDDTSKQPKKEG